MGDSKLIKVYQINLWKHVERMEDQRIRKIIFKYNPPGKRNQGRSQKKFKDKFLI
jgi:hypothetical protein